jgi:hypothetical protein
VTDRHPLDIGDIYIKKFDIRPSERIVTAGSCFAQHIATRLRLHGYNVLDAEPPPPGLSLDTAKKFGFALYSARYGNLYTIRQLLQLLQECSGERSPVEVVWEGNGRYFDALRPSVEPEGLSSAEAVRQHRDQHLARVHWLVNHVSLFIFTFGLTEAWVHREDGTVYPTAPGTIAGSYDPAKYEFKNFAFQEVFDDFCEIRERMRGRNGNIRFLLTVSPVPLTATASRNHIVPATVYSKSILRAVAGQLATQFSDIDYFPSYEMVAGHHADNLRTVSPGGVDVVMRSFFDQHRSNSRQDEITPQSTKMAPPLESPENYSVEQDRDGRVFCDEELLEKFAT